LREWRWWRWLYRVEGVVVEVVEGLVVVVVEVVV